MNVRLEHRCTDLIAKLGLALREDVSSVERLTGGVASDIVVVDFGDRTVCVKFAFEKLRVAEEWHAPVDRNGAEYAWLEFAGKTVPGAAPTLYGRDSDLNGFAMEFVQGGEIYLWKTALLERQPSRGEAAKVGRVLGRIHAASAKLEFDANSFQNQSDFYDLRIDPYLGFTANVHPELATVLQQLMISLRSDSTVLIHGDVSPKNILFRGGQPVFLDAECATMGDPSFDIAFCLNHLVLKSIHMPDRANELLEELQAFWASYAEHINWEDERHLETRVCALLPALMLARVDGKSPVEYLNDPDRRWIREVTIPLVTEAPGDLSEFIGRINAARRG